MKTPNDGGPAFPHQVKIHKHYDDGSMMTSPITTGGMSLRDYFAAAALPTVLANPISIANVAEQYGEAREESLAAICYSLADAMIAERAKGGGK
jgi:hypothetical protein